MVIAKHLLVFQTEQKIVNTSKAFRKHHWHYCSMTCVMANSQSTNTVNKHRHSVGCWIYNVGNKTVFAWHQQTPANLHTVNWK